jgi:hypothetical protein
MGITDFSQKGFHIFWRKIRGWIREKKMKIIMKCESSINGRNLQEKKEECVTEEQRLLDHYDEETVLLQIPQDDTGKRIHLSKILIIHFQRNNCL